MSCRQIFEDCKIYIYIDARTHIVLFFSYILEIISFVEKYEVVAKNLDTSNHNARRKLNLHAQHCKTLLFKKNLITMGISLYNKVLDQIKLKENVN
jgi:hypothetical protein